MDIRQKKMQEKEDETAPEAQARLGIFCALLPRIECHTVLQNTIPTSCQHKPRSPRQSRDAFMKMFAPPPEKRPLPDQVPEVPVKEEEDHS